MGHVVLEVLHLLTSQAVTKQIPLSIQFRLVQKLFALHELLEFNSVFILLGRFVRIIIAVGVA